MKQRILLFSVLLVFLASFALAQAPSAANRAAIEKQIVANERAVNEAFAKHDSKTFHLHVAPDAMNIDNMGVSKVNGPDFEKMMMAVKVETWNIDGSQFQWIDDNTVVHAYRWTGKGTYEGQPVPSPTWASTVWMNKGGKWQAVFHQETAAMVMGPAPAKK